MYTRVREKGGRKAVRRAKKRARRKNTLLACTRRSEVRRGERAGFRASVTLVRRDATRRTRETPKEYKGYLCRAWRAATCTRTRDSSHVVGLSHAIKCVRVACESRGASATLHPRQIIRYHVQWDRACDTKRGALRQVTVARYRLVSMQNWISTRLSIFREGDIERKTLVSRKRLDVSG